MGTPQVSFCISELSLPLIFYAGVCYGVHLLIPNSDIVEIMAVGHPLFVSTPLQSLRTYPWQAYVPAGVGA